MSCDEVLALIAQISTGLAAESLRASVEEHLQGCPSCKRAADELRATVELVRAIEPREAPATVAPPSFDAVLARTRSPSRRARRVLPRAAALILAALAGVAADRAWLSRTPPKTDEAPSPPKQEAPTADEARRELAARPGSLGAQLAYLGSLQRRR